MKWSDRAVRHHVASGNPDAVGIERAGSQVSAFRTTTAGYQATNWRDYPGGTGPSDSWGYQVYADYEDALYPNENPRAVITGEDNYGEMEYQLSVTDGSGQQVVEETFYDLSEAKASADKKLQKLYKSEGKIEPGQGKFFTTPGKGKLFSGLDGLLKGAPFAEYEDWDSCFEASVRTATPRWLSDLADRATRSETADVDHEIVEELASKPLTGDPDVDYWINSAQTSKADGTDYDIVQGLARMARRTAADENWDEVGYGYADARVARTAYTDDGPEDSSYRKRAIEELYKELKSFSVGPQSIDKVLDRLIENGYTNQQVALGQADEDDLWDVVEELRLVGVRTARRRTRSGSRTAAVPDSVRGLVMDAQFSETSESDYAIVDALAQVPPTGDWRFDRLIEDAKASQTEESDLAIVQELLRLSSRKTASRRHSWSLLDQVNTAPVHRVAGWDWDHQIEGYVSDGVADFACICGSNVEAPGHVVCACGKLWNSYQIASSDGVRLVCREVPVRDGVLLANRKP